MNDLVSPEKPLKLSFALDEATGQLQVQFDPDDNVVVPDMPALRQILHDRGFASYYLDETALAQFVQACAEAKGLLTVCIGERRNAAYSLEFSDDQMSAFLTLVPEQGGLPIGLEVEDGLRQQGVTMGLLHQVIDAAIASGSCQKLLIAQGEAAQQGHLGRFEKLFDLTHKKPAPVDDRAMIKFIDLSQLLIVHAGDALMRRIPPVPGKNGLNVKGEVILARPIPDMPFGLPLLGAEPDQNDPDLLIATHAGQPVLVESGVIVNLVIKVPNVDLSTGNIRFEGTIHVAGDIKSGMRVEVTGDVIVDGMIETAEIIAGGNVAVKGGVIGRAEKKQGSHALSESTTRIRCQGTMQAMFAENSHIEAGSSIQIDSNTRQCELIARDQIVVGKSASKTGQIIGGKAQAGMLIEAGVIGTTATTLTSIQVGVDPYLEEQIARQRGVIKQKMDDLDQVLKLLLYFAHNPLKNVGGVADKVEQKRVQQLAEIDALSITLHELEEQLELIEQACITVGNVIHDGAEIMIGKHAWKVQEDAGPGVYRVDNGQIVLV